MIPQGLRLIQTGELPGEVVDFKIGDPRWIMYSLSDLYSDIITACIREYSTNAWDAHVEAGTTDVPIRITLPTLYHPYFEVEDFGVGMSLDTLRDVWTSFGDSTKRGDNNQNGMLGFGSKAAAAYSDQFEVASTKNGWTTHGLVSRAQDYAITLTIASHKQTEKQNGTKITIPVSKDYQEFTQKAEDFYRFWLPGTVLVDGVVPNRAVGEKIDDNLYYSTVEGTSYLVMGNVPYKINNSNSLFSTRGINSVSFVAYVPIGAVDFSKTREDLAYTDRTKDALEKIIDDFQEKVRKQSKKDIESASTYYDAWLARRKWSGKLGQTDYHEMSFDGKKLIDVFPVTGRRFLVNGYNRSSLYPVHQWSLHEITTSLFVLEAPDVPTSYTKSKVRDYINAFATDVSYVLLTSEKNLQVDWVPSDRVITWEKLKERAPKKSRPAKTTTTAPGRIAGSWDYYDKHQFHGEKTIPNNAILYYIETVAKNRLPTSMSIVNILKLIDDDGVVVILPANRKAKFLRENPKAKSFMDYMESYITWDGKKLLSPTGKKILSLTSVVTQWVERLKNSKIHDPEIKSLQAALENKDSHLSEYNRHYQLAGMTGRKYKFKRFGPGDSNNQYNPFDSYTLLEGLSFYRSSDMIDDVVIYINAAYQARVNKSI